MTPSKDRPNFTRGKVFDSIRLDNELRKIEAEWLRERQAYLTIDESGHMYEPASWRALLGGMTTLVIGGLAIAGGYYPRVFGLGQPITLLILIGGLILVVGCSYAIYAWRIAAMFEAAHERYELRCREATDRYGHSQVSANSS